MRNQTDHPFDQHELASVVYLMFLHSEDHFESRLLSTRFHRDAFVEEIRRQVFQPLRKDFAARAQKFKNLCFGPWRGTLGFLLRQEPRHEASEIGSLKRIVVILAALAIEHGCEWITTDGDYAKFPGLRWRSISAEES